MKLKRALAVVLILICLFFTASAENPSANGLNLSVGMQYEGFEVAESLFFQELNTQGFVFRHQRTGASVLYLPNGDPNRVFSMTFRTPAPDDSGVPHVFEHATLGGSEKAPSRSLFFNLAYQTYNTYLNAATYDIMTTYPAASLSEAQLLRYADFFLDSAFHPMLMKDRTLFEREAWRYTLKSKDAPLGLAGTVYSEMQGSYTLESDALQNAYRTLFPGSTFGNYFGGKPEKIPGMTWEQLRQYHDKYYHPSNALFCLYGAIEDPRAFLKLMDQAFQYDRRSDFASDDGYRPLTEPQKAVFSYPVEQGQTASPIFYDGFLLGQPSKQEMAALKLLCILLNEPSSYFQQRLYEAVPSASANCFIEEGGPEAALLFGFNNGSDGDEAVFHRVVTESLKQLSVEGFGQSAIDASLKGVHMERLLRRENQNAGVELLAQLARYWSRYGSFDDFVTQEKDMTAQANTAALKDVLNRFLLQNNRNAQILTKAEPGLAEKHADEMEKNLREVKASMSPAQIEQLVQSTAALSEPPKEDVPGLLEKFQAITVETLPKTIKRYDLKEQTDSEGVRHVTVSTEETGMGQPALLLSARGLTQEQLHWYKLYADLMGNLPTTAHSVTELSSLLSQFLYRGEIEADFLPQSDGSMLPFLLCSWLSTPEDQAKGYEVLNELLYQMRFDDVAALKNALSLLRADLEDNLMTQPESFLLRRALASGSPVYAAKEYLYGLPYQDFLQQVELQLQTAPQKVTQQLIQISRFFQNKEGAVSAFAGSPSEAFLHRTVADHFLSGLESRPRKETAYAFPLTGKDEAYVTHTPVQNNLVYADYKTLGLKGYTGEWEAVCSLVADALLYPLLRDQYGVYSIVHQATREGLFICTDRDPGAENTLALYGRLPELLSGLSVDQKTLNGYILSAHASLMASAGELSGAVNVLRDYLQGHTQEERQQHLQELMRLTPETFRQLTAAYKRLAEAGTFYTMGGDDAIRQAAHRFNRIFEPLAF